MRGAFAAGWLVMTSFVHPSPLQPATAGPARRRQADPVDRRRAGVDRSYEDQHADSRAPWTVG